MNKIMPMPQHEERSQELSVIEQVVMQGDLSKLNPEQRVTYYRKVCESAGLNPFTRPFDYISLNGKLTLYAKKDATEQLRKLNGISIEKMESQIIDDLYIVKVTATTKDGRIDQSTGAVTIGNLKADAKANAIMKAETKAKRRVTLSISGMGWTDETEIESIPHAKPVEVDLETGEIKKAPPIETSSKKLSIISREQFTELKAILDECEQSYISWLFDHLAKKFKIQKLEELPSDMYQELKMAAIQQMQQNHAKQKSEYETPVEVV